MSRALGRYELLRPLARGGMAEIYLARRRAAGIEKLLVVKRLRAERAGDARFLELFVREARLSMSLTHQNIVPVFDFGRSGDQVFLAMERVEGKDLGGSLARPGAPPLPPVVVAFVGAECCQALDYAHHRKRDDGAALGVVHRDVTPRNVLVSWSGEVKLTDFGIATLAGEETSRLIGTPGYMAPEQARGEAIDARADLYATGLVLREALTGQRARPGADRDALIAAARRGEVSPWPPGPYPAGLVAIIDRATAADPAARFPDARAMLAALDGFIVAERAAHPGEPPARRLAAWLAEAWAGAREEEAAAEVAAIERPELLSMFDDAGTGTERSLAATATSDPAASAAAAAAAAAPMATPGSESPAAAPAAPAAMTAAAPAARAAGAPVAPAAGSGSSAASISSESPVSPVARRRLLMVLPLVGVLVIGALAIGLVLGRGSAGSSGPDPRDAAASAAPAVPVVTLAADAAAPNADAAVVADAASAVALAVDSAVPPADAAVALPRPWSAADVARPPAPRAPDAGTTPADAAASAARALRKVRVNARPWATFTVDGGAAQYETISTIELAPGPHRLHFSNPQLGVERDVTIDVPADRDLDHVEDLRR
jgi:tRNA A-37 threonylcarbamoyl transferase component Bud32